MKGRNEIKFLKFVIKSDLLLGIFLSVFFFSNLELVSAQTPMLSDNLVAYFNLDETSGTTAIDLVNGDHDASLVGGVTQGQSGVLNTAYSFDGNNDFLDLTNPPLVCEDDNICSISMWVKFSNTNIASIWYEGTTGQYWSIRLSVTAGGLALEVRNSMGMAEVLTVPTSISDNQWHHVAITGNGNQSSVFIDSSLSVQGTFTILPQGPTLLTLDENFGRQTQGDYWQGEIDEIGMWNRTLSPLEVALLYNNGNGMTYPFSIMTPIGIQQTLENQTLTFQPTINNPPGYNVSFNTNAGSVIRSNYSFNIQTGLVSWTPNFWDSGVYDINIGVTNGVISNNQTVTLVVNDSSLATITVNGTANVGSQVQFLLHAPNMPNEDYLFLGSLGAYPGLLLPGNFFIPLNDDFVFYSMFYYPFLLGFSDTLGTLDGQGMGVVTWDIPNVPSWAGININFAFATKRTLSNGQLILGSVNPEMSVTLLP